MTGRFPARLARGDGYEAAELTYGRQNFSLVAILPDAGPMSALATRLAGGLWDEIAARLDAPVPETTLQDVQVTLPRFSFSTDAPLTDALQALGMTDAFSGAADLSPMSDAGLSVSGVQQNTFVALDEVGTEAAAVTQVTVAVSSVPEFTATRPFVFVIRERTTGTVLFVGQVTDPSR